MRTASLIGNLVLALSTVIIAHPAWAQEYPVKPIRLVVPNPPGGGNDVIARLFAQKLSEAWGQQVVVENRGGAGTTIGTAYVAHAAPDGYTLIMSLVSSHAVSPNLYRDPGYDPIKDFTPITVLVVSPMLLGVTPTLPVKSMRELIALAKKNPGTITYASGGGGSPMHMSAEIFKRMAGIDLVHVPYKGGGPAQLGIAIGEAYMGISTTGSMLSMVQARRIRALAVGRAARLADYPEIPTFAEAGMPGYDTNTWYSMHAPAGTPDAIADKLNRELVRILGLPDMKERLRQLSSDGVGYTRQQTGVFVQSELAKYAKVIKDAGIKGE
ncbi:MAG: tripartite tricarboxylate transporter substrate binding protein [Betaproteobacteria bacterium]|nr:tripartite tricarboxylate transporter substrate binding protein [Betaproteobacteria bacterium]